MRIDRYTNQRRSNGDIRVRTGCGLLVCGVKRVGGEPGAVAGAARVVRVHGQPQARGRRQFPEYKIGLVGRHVGQHGRRWPVGGHGGPAVPVVRDGRAPAARVAGRIVRFQGEPLRHAAVESSRTFHVHRHQRPVAGSAVERRVRSHCDGVTIMPLITMENHRCFYRTPPINR